MMVEPRIAEDNRRAVFPRGQAVVGSIASPAHRTLLALFAHPDDETFACGGTLAYYAHQGVRVVLGCATRGEAGVVHQEVACCPEDMGLAREEELRCACRVLGIQELRFLGYRDSGMEDGPEQEHPLAFVQADSEEVVGRILELCRLFQPLVMLTYGPEGGSGHRDHVAIHRYASEAWRRAGDPQQCPDLARNPPRKLYYVARSRRLYRRFRQDLWRRGLLPEPPTEAQIRQRGVPEECITTVVPVGAFLETRLQALRCHRTQLSSGHPYIHLPEDLRREYLSIESFTLAAARGLEIVRGEADLFAGLPQ